MGYPKGRPQSQESIEKRRAANRAKWDDPEYRIRMAERLVARTQSESARASRTATMKWLARSGALADFFAAAHSDVTKEKARVGRAAALRRPEVREKQRMITKANMASGVWSPDFREKNNSPEAIAKRLATNRSSGAMARAVAAMNASMGRPEVRAKLSADRKKRLETEAGRAALARARVLANTPEARRRLSESHKAYARTPEGRAAKIRGGVASFKSLMGAAKHKGWIHGNVGMRSSWEVLFARFLDFIGTSWEYEPECFSLPGGYRYTPDFLVDIPGTGKVFVEIKGACFTRGIVKFRKWQDIYKRPALMLGQEHIEAIRRLLK